MNFQTTVRYAVIAIGAFLFASAQNSFSAIATVDVSKKYQTIEGFGGGFNFGVYPYGRGNKEELYDSIFNKAGINIVRIGNHYDPQKDSAVDEIPMMREIQQKWPHVKVMLTSWSPPPYLKSNNSINCLLNQNDRDTGTLKKDSTGLFMYEAYGDYWLKSVRHFQDSGVTIHWLSIQNEPNWAPKTDGCIFAPSDSFRFASYGKAFDVVFNKLSTTPDPIPLIGPDVTGIGFNNLQKYMSSPDMHANQLVALCHHFYNGADSASMHAVAAAYPNVKLYQTEFLINEGASGRTWFDHAQIMQLSLAEEGVSMYNIFALAYRKVSTHCFFSLDSLSDSFQVRPMYYAFKHFSKSIHRGWRRVDAAVNEAGLMISAFADSSGDSMAIVVINKNNSATTLSLPLPGPNMKAAVYQTTETKKYAEMDGFSGSGDIALDPKSITTIEAPPQIIKSRTVLQTQGSTSRPALLRTSVQRMGNICVSFRVLPFSSYRISLFDVIGKKLSSFAGKVIDHNGISTHLFEGPMPNGVYMVSLECNGNIYNSSTAVLR